MRRRWPLDSASVFERRCDDEAETVALEMLEVCGEYFGAASAGTRGEQEQRADAHHVASSEHAREGRAERALLVGWRD